MPTNIGQNGNYVISLQTYHNSSVNVLRTYLEPLIDICRELEVC